MPVGPADGVRVESVVNMDNVDNTQLVARARLLRAVGRASRDTMVAICRVLAIAVDCPGA